MNHNLTKYLLRLDLEGNYKPNVAIHGTVKLNNCSPAGSTRTPSRRRRRTQKKKTSSSLEGLFFVDELAASLPDLVFEWNQGKEAGGRQSRINQYELWCAHECDTVIRPLK